MKKFFILVVAILLLVAGSGVFAGGGAQVAFLNVGQGDAILIRTKEGQNILVDGGRGGSVVAALDRELPLWDRKIDLLINTHPDEDHLGGLVDVLTRFEVGEVAISPVFKEASNQVAAKFLELVESKGTPLFMLTTKSKVALTGNAALAVLNPVAGSVSTDLNENSIVCRVSIGSVDFLLTGDAGFATEERLTSSAPELLNSEFLKVAHHGSKYATSAAFLKLVQPQAAVVSVGKNNYGHPDPALLTRLAQSGAKVLRTDELGNIVVEVKDGKADVFTH